MMSILMPAIESSAPSGCCYSGDMAAGCVCPDSEKSLRMFSAGMNSTPMTPEQREECLKEISSIEGYDRADYEHLEDKWLAKGVLHAWVDYCRDKGLL